MKKINEITFNCIYHIVWCTQYKRPVLDKVISKTVTKVLKDVAAENNFVIDNLAVYPDHVEMVIRIDPKKSIHSAVKLLKNRSASAIWCEHPEIKKVSSSVWTRKYMVSTEGILTRMEIDEFLKDQKTRKEVRRIKKW